MRKNTKEVLVSFLRGDANHNHKSISTDSCGIFSYKTEIVYWRNEFEIVVNIKKYSKTTTEQQNDIREGLRLAGYSPIDYPSAKFNGCVIYRKVNK